MHTVYKIKILSLVLNSTLFTVPSEDKGILSFVLLGSRINTISDWIYKYITLLEYRNTHRFQSIMFFIIIHNSRWLVKNK
uniref:Uncharacterized protein n=1 Tax=Anguilla anguilla TaxID=7936 RepID=A0A0E9WUU0_ANGAN